MLRIVIDWIRHNPNQGSNIGSIHGPHGPYTHTPTPFSRGGLGGMKESGQLRFGGRERPFRAPLRPIPYDELKKLGIPPPPEGRYMTRYQVPPPPRRESSKIDIEDSPPRRRSKDKAGVSTYRRRRSSNDDDETPRRRKSSRDGLEESQSRRSARSSITREDNRYSSQRKSKGHDEGHHKLRQSQEPGEVYLPEEDGSYERERTSDEPGRSPDRYHHHWHHRDDTYESRHSRHWDHRKRRRSQELGEVSPPEEDGSYERERTSDEPGRSPDRYHHRRHHRNDTYESKHSRHRDHRKRRRSQEPSVSPTEEDGSYERERASDEPGRSSDRYHHHRHHKEDAYESRHSHHRDRQRHGDRHHTKRSESQDYRD